MSSIEQIGAMDARGALAPAIRQVAIAERFVGRRVLVTGAGSGIGAATARQFVAEGAHVTGVDVNAEGLERTRASLGDGAGRFQALTADITDLTGQAGVIEAACGPDGALDALVNNAAVFLLAGVEATIEQWQRTLDVNLVAPAQLTATAAAALARAEAGAVVNVASISGHVSQADRWTYNASKGGVLSLTRCQALDLAPRGIRVNSVSPGLDRGARPRRRRRPGEMGTGLGLVLPAQPVRRAVRGRRRDRLPVLGVGVVHHRLRPARRRRPGRHEPRRPGDLRVQLVTEPFAAGACRTAGVTI